MSERLSVLTSPMKTLTVFSRVLLKAVVRLVGYIRTQWVLSLTFAALSALMLLFASASASHLQWLRIERATRDFIVDNIKFALYWIVLGVLSSIGLGSGLHTFVLFLGPHILRIAYAGVLAGSTGFSGRIVSYTKWPGSWDFAGLSEAFSPEYAADAFDTAAGAGAAASAGAAVAPVSFLTLAAKVAWPAFLWGLGTSLGELPPYFIARAARLAGQSVGELSEVSRLEHELSSDDGSDEELVDLTGSSGSRHTGAYGGRTGRGTAAEDADDIVILDSDEEEHGPGASGTPSRRRAAGGAGATVAGAGASGAAGGGGAAGYRARALAGGMSVIKAPRRRAGSSKPVTGASIGSGLALASPPSPGDLLSGSSSSDLALPVVDTSARARARQRIRRLSEESLTDLKGTIQHGFSAVASGAGRGKQAAGQGQGYGQARGSGTGAGQHSTHHHHQHLSFGERAKLVLYEAIQAYGFWAVLAAASIPNPLFDLAGLTCGHFGIPFGTFFSATFIGKAVIKVSIQASSLLAVVLYGPRLFERMRLLSSPGSALRRLFDGIETSMLASQHSMCLQPGAGGASSAGGTGAGSSGNGLASAAVSLADCRSCCVSHFNRPGMGVEQCLDMCGREGVGAAGAAAAATGQSSSSPLRSTALDFTKSLLGVKGPGASAWIKAAWGWFLLAMVVYFVASIVDSLVAGHLADEAREASLEAQAIGDSSKAVTAGHGTGRASRVTSGAGPSAGLASPNTALAASSGGAGTGRRRAGSVAGRGRASMGGSGAGAGAGAGAATAASAGTVQSSDSPYPSGTTAGARSAAPGSVAAGSAAGNGLGPGSSVGTALTSPGTVTTTGTGRYGTGTGFHGTGSGAGVAGASVGTAATGAGGSVRTTGTEASRFTESSRKRVKRAMYGLADAAAAAATAAATAAVTGASGVAGAGAASAAAALQTAAAVLQRGSSGAGAGAGRAGSAAGSTSAAPAGTPAKRAGSTGRGGAGAAAGGRGSRAGLPLRYGSSDTPGSVSTTARGRTPSGAKTPTSSRKAPSSSSKPPSSSRPPSSSSKRPVSASGKKRYGPGVYEVDRVIGYKDGPGLAAGDSAAAGASAGSAGSGSASGAGASAPARFRIRWVGYGPEDDSWETIDAFIDRGPVHEYLRSIGKKIKGNVVVDL